MKNKFSQKMILPLLLLFGSFIYAQSSVTGVVSDASGPLPGVNVLVKDSDNGAQTDFDGLYEINNVSPGDVLVYSFVGFATQEIVAGSQSQINVTLQPDSQLDTVVLIGYGATTKKDATGSIDVISTDDFNQGVITSPEQLLQGRSAGVQVTTASGEPGSGATIRIRGTASVTSGNDPLYVIDGVPFNNATNGSGASTGELGGNSSAKNPLNFINSADIESISILKDASATAIYGSRAANGVIIVTTKSGKNGQGKLNYSITSTTASVSNSFDLLDSAAYAAANPAGDQGSSVDAFKEITRSAVTTEHNLSYSGGSDSGRYRLSLGLLNQEGVVKNTGLDKYTFNTSISQKFFQDALKISANLTASQIESEATALSESIGAEGDMLLSALKWNPTQSFYNADGTYLQPSPNQRNPLAYLDYYSDDSETTKLFGNVKAKLNFTDDLNYEFTYGFDRTNAYRGIAASRLLNTTSSFNRGYATVGNTKFTNKLFTNTLSYNKDVSDNFSVNAVVGHTYENYTGSGEQLTLQDFDSEDQNSYLDNIFAAGTVNRTGYTSLSYNPSNNSVGFLPISLQSYFARGIFKFNDKYILTATVRADGSSRFGGNNKYGYFPAFAAAWKVDQEGFLPESISTLKLRAGWGETGNQQFNAEAGRDVFVPGVGGGVTRLNFGNPDLKWETTTQLNVGVDFGILDDKLTGNVDYFKKNTTDLLFRTPVAQPGPVGAFSWSNFTDEIINSGVEVGLNLNAIENDNFTLDIGGNISFLNNEVVGNDVFTTGVQTGTIDGNGLGDNSQLIYDGQSLYAFYLPVFEGFDSSGAAIYADTNGDGTVNTNFDQPGASSDRDFVGDPNPDVNVGLYVRAGYKDWDFSVNGYGAYGHQIYNNTANALFTEAALTRNENVTENVLTEGGVGAAIISTRFLEDGDFFRLSNASLGYTLNGEKLGKIGKYFSSARIALTGQNLFIITDYTGLDPEVNANKAVDGVPSFGIEYSGYPRSRSFSLGLNLNF